MDDGNRSHLVLQNFQSNIFQTIIRPSLCITGAIHIRLSVSAHSSIKIQNYFEQTDSKFSQARAFFIWQGTLIIGVVNPIISLQIPSTADKLDAYRSPKLKKSKKNMQILASLTCVRVYVFYFISKSFTCEYDECIHVRALTAVRMKLSTSLRSYRKCRGEQVLCVLHPFGTESQALTWTRCCRGNDSPLPSIAPVICNFPSFQAAIVCVSSSSSVKFDPWFPSWNLVDYTC